MLASYPVALSHLPSLEPRICIINTVSVQVETVSEPCLRVSQAVITLSTCWRTKDLLIEFYNFPSSAGST